MHYTSTENLKSLFLNLGLKKNQSILVHSSLISLGVIEKGVKGFYDALRSVLGPDGTIIVPTFTYSFRRNEIFDILNSPSPKQLGVFSEFVRLLPNSFRSDDPLFSFSGDGPLSEKLLIKKNKNCFGEGSVFENLFENKVKILSIGLTYSNGITPFIHIEKLAKVPYRIDKNFHGLTIDVKGVKYNDYAIHFVKDEKKITCRENMGSILERKKISNLIKCETNYHRLINFNDMVSCTLDILKKDPFYMLKN